MSENRPIPIILDTDIGDNVDDALALAFACQCPQLRLVGVSTVYRDPWRRAGIALATLNALDRRDVPVAAGIGKPLFRPWDRSAPKHYELKFAKHVKRLDRRHAVRFLIQTVNTEAVSKVPAPLNDASGKTLRELFEPVTVCCIGPLTNLAVALATEPTLAEQIRIVLMGGMIGERRLETNIAADPEAAKLVFSCGADIIMVGLDVTLQCVLTSEQLERIRSCDRPHTRLLSRMIDSWLTQSGRQPVLHDPLAVAMCFDPSLCGIQSMEITVETSDDGQAGRTVAHASADRRTNVCTTVDRDRFINLFLNRICSAPRAIEE